MQTNTYYSLNKERLLELRKLFPWKQTLKHIKTRCNNSNHHSYKYYGARGIKCLITEEELRELWFRDNASNMFLPTIDRKENDGNYTFKNCRYIEQGINSAERNKRVLSKKVLQYDLQGNFIREWNSLVSIKTEFGFNYQNIWACIIGKTKHSHGFIWKYNKNF